MGFKINSIKKPIIIDKVEQLEKNLSSAKVEVQEELLVSFHGSKERRIWQYVDNIGLILLLIGVFFLLDAGVDLLYKNDIADTQTSAQRYTVQDIEGILLALIATGIVLASIKLMLEIAYDSIHWFIETEADSSWTSFKAFQKMSPFQQWIIFVSLLYISSQIFVGILRALA